MLDYSKVFRGKKTKQKRHCSTGHTKLKAHQPGWLLGRGWVGCVFKRSKRNAGRTTTTRGHVRRRHHAIMLMIFV